MSQESQAAQLNEARRQALAAQELQAEEPEAEEPEAPQQAARKPSPKKADPVTEMAQRRLRWWMWGLAIPTLGLSLLVLYALYIIRPIASWLQKYVPTPKFWEPHALRALTVILFCAAMVSFVVIFTPALAAIGLFCKIPFAC